MLNAVRTLGWTILPLLVIGCGRDTAQVSGKVLWKDGTPLTGEIRVIRFEPTSDSTAKIKKAAFADIADDGSFTMLTRQPGDGVFLGQYVATFTVLKTAMGRESLIPDRYTSARQSPFPIEVQGDMRDLLFELEKD